MPRNKKMTATEEMEIIPSPTVDELESRFQTTVVIPDDGIPNEYWPEPLREIDARISKPIDINIKLQDIADIVAMIEQGKKDVKAINAVFLEQFHDEYVLFGKVFSMLPGNHLDSRLMEKVDEARAVIARRMQSTWPE